MSNWRALGLAVAGPFLLVVLLGLSRVLSWPVVGPIGGGWLFGLAACSLPVAGRLAGAATLFALWGAAGWPLVGLLGGFLALAAGRRGGALLSCRRPFQEAGGNGSVVIGRDQAGGQPLSLPLRHTVVVGASGSGKTFTLTKLLRGAVGGHAVVVVDGKGDPDLERALTDAVLCAGKPFAAWCPWGRVAYNPFAHGGETELVDKALAAEQFSDTYYLRLAQRFLGFAVRALRGAGMEVTVAALARYADPTRLVELAGAFEGREPGSWSRFAHTLPKLSPAERQAAAGTQHRLATVAESDVGPLLSGYPGERIDLLATVAEGGVVYFNLNADARPELSRMVGAAILIDLLSVAASNQRAGRYSPTVVVVDDLQAFASEPTLRALASLCARGRSAGFAVVLATQTLADLQFGKERRYYHQILDNRHALLAHRLAGADSAKAVSAELGTTEGERIQEALERHWLGWRSGARASRSWQEKPLVPPYYLRALPVGYAYLQIGTEPPRLLAVSAT